MFAAGLQCPGHRDFAMSAMLVNLGINLILCLSAKGCNISVRPIMGCLDSMPGQRYNLCARLICMVAKFVIECLGVCKQAHRERW